MSLPSSLRDQEICVLGLGYVGLTFAVAMADLGFRVHGIEPRRDVLELLEQGEPHFWEPRLKQKLQRVIRQGRFTFSEQLDGAVSSTAYVITVGTPLGEDGKARLDRVEQAVRQVSEHMPDGALVILRSTVKLGTARRIVKPVLEATGRSFSLAVCPERTLEGKALIELHELPQIIGADDATTRVRCAQLFSIITPTTLTLSSLEAAELTKLIDNAYRDVSFAFANEVARLCGQAGLSAVEIIRAGRQGYQRTNVALPGPVGGPCLEKDSHILAESAAEFGVELPITYGARGINEQQPAETARLIKERVAGLKDFPSGPIITVAGLAFKGRPPTDDLRGTMAKPIIAAFRNEFPGARVRGYDPIVKAEAARDYFGIETVPSLEEAFRGTHMLIIANNHPQFETMEVPALAETMEVPALVYDYWNLHDDVINLMPEGVLYISLGSEKIGMHV